ncbi:MAG: glycosyltransferase, partial [Myxococcota bacterium]
MTGAALASSLLYFAVLLALSAYGLHRLHLVILCRRHREKIASAAEHAGTVVPAFPPVSGVRARSNWEATPNAAEGGSSLPMVTVQLPIFNESTVVERLLRRVGEMDYPRDRLHIQVLDDSTDETRAIAEAEVERLRRRGYLADYLHRTDRTGYKAGALEAGLPQAKGDLIAIFDADFLPNRDFLTSLVGHFADPEVGMVQARWAHLNRNASLLTKIQALMLDGHHMVENRARYGAGLLFNFSGTGG